MHALAALVYLCHTQSPTRGGGTKQHTPPLPTWGRRGTKQHRHISQKPVPPTRGWEGGDKTAFRCTMYLIYVHLAVLQPMTIFILTSPWVICQNTKRESKHALIQMKTCYRAVVRQLQQIAMAVRWPYGGRTVAVRWPHGGHRYLIQVAQR